MALDPKRGQFWKQVESEAETYGPSVYALLSFYQGLALETEPLDGLFTGAGTSTVREAWGRGQTQIFAVGVIPPTAGGISRLLDRSASLATLAGSYEEIIAANPDVGSSSSGDVAGETGGVGTSKPVPVGPKTTDSNDFYMQYVAMCNRLGCQPEELAAVIQTESSWNEHIVAERGEPKHPVAKGLIQFIKKTAAGYNIDWENYEKKSRIEQLPDIEKFLGKRAKGKDKYGLKAIIFGAANNNPDPRPGGSIYFVGAKEPEYKRAAFQQTAYRQNAASDRDGDGYITKEDLFVKLSKTKVNPDVLAGIARAKERLGMGPPPAPTIPQDAPPATEFQATGRENAQAASQTRSQVAAKDLNQTNLGKAFQAAQKSAILEMQAALDRMAETPPLRLVVNPQSFRVSSEKLISEGNWGRNGPIIEHWGENQDKIEGSGKIAAYFAKASSALVPLGGLTRTGRQFSASYQNLLSLFLLYRNNGGVWLPDPLVPSSAHVKNLAVVGSVYLYYDKTLYVGSFDSLNLSESDDAPFTLEYSFSFTVRAWYLLDYPYDPRYTYGLSQGTGLPTGASESPLMGGNNPQPSPDVPLPTVSRGDDPLFGLNEGDVGDDLEGILEGIET